MRWWGWIVNRGTMSKIERTLTAVLDSDIPENMGKYHTLVFRSMLGRGNEILKDPQVRHTIEGLVQFWINNKKDLMATLEKFVDVAVEGSEGVEFSKDETVEKIKEIWTYDSFS